MLSPAHRPSAYNDITVRYYSETVTSSTPRKRDRNTTTTEDSDSHSISMTINEVGRPPGKLCDLSTIQENKTVSDAERSGDTTSICDEESCTSNKKFDLFFGESCKTVKEPLPLVTVAGSEKTVLSKLPKDAKETLADIFGNNLDDRDYVIIDKTFINMNEVKATKRPIKHSYSLDLGGVPKEGSKRKFSIETKLETFSPSKIFSKDGVVCKLFESESKQRRDSVKSYLCRNDGIDSEDDNL